MQESRVRRGPTLLIGRSRPLPGLVHWVEPPRSLNGGSDSGVCAPMCSTDRWVWLPEWLPFRNPDPLIRTSGPAC
jgi:hypothetical protein